MTFTKRIHVFKAGDQTSAQGVQRNFSEKDLQQVVDTYDPAVHTAPLVIGHSGDNDSVPAFGWIKGFQKQGANLYADVEFSPTARDLVKDGHYRKVSISFYSPDSAINPSKGKWSARHLALLGASPPAVKGLEPFSFSEAEGVYDFAVSLAPSDIFDDELGPTLIVEKSPLEMLREKLDAVREDVSSAVKELQGNQQTQPTEQIGDAAATSATQEPEAAQMANPDASQFRETSKHVGREGTEIAQQTADLETQFPEEEFMDQGKISRKHAKGAHGQVMQVVENVYDEAHGELPEAFKKQIEKKKAKSAEEGMDAKHSEDDMTDSGVQKRHGGDGGPGSADHAENEEGRYETARSTSDGYVDRMRTGKSGPDGNVGRMKTAKSGEQDSDRMHTAENGEQESDRMRTAKASKGDAEGESRWAGQEDGYDQAMNSDQYDAGAKDYGVNTPKVSSGNDPYGRDETETKMPTESEEMPDDEIFAVSTVNVMSDGSMRVLRTKSSNSRAKSAKMHDLLYAEGGPQADEMTSEDGVTTARKSMKGSKMVEHAEYETDDADSGASLDTLRDEIGDGKKSKSRQLTPGAMDDTDTPGEIVGPSGAFAESYKGEPKAKSKQLTPAGMDTTDEENQVTGPSGVYKEASLESLRQEIGDGKKSKAKQLKPGAMDTVTDPAEVSKKSGGVFAEEHGEKKDPYTKTGFGSTYDEGEGDDGVDEGDEDYNELSTDHACGGGMNYGMTPEMEYGMGSMGQAKAVGFPQQMYEELQALKSKYAEMERRHAEEKMMHRRQQMASFVEALYTEGRLTDGVMPEQELISYCEGLEFGTMEFAEGETAATKLLGLLSKLPPMVSFGEVAGGTFQYAEEDLDPHAKALQMVEQSEGKMDYVEALKKTMFS